MSMKYALFVANGNDEAADNLRRGKVTFSKPSRTKQAMKDECDINNILRKYEKTGMVTHVAKHGGEYGFVPAIDLMGAYETIQRAEAMFEDLPAAARKRFENSPMKFLEFVQDPANRDELVKLGLGKETVTPTPAPTPAPAPAPGG